MTGFALRSGPEVRRRVLESETSVQIKRNEYREENFCAVAAARSGIPCCSIFGEVQLPGRTGKSGRGSIFPGLQPGVDFAQLVKLVSLAGKGSFHAIAL